MIRVPCKCRNVLELPDDQAGLSVQCPRCGLLVDVPLLSDIPQIASDGTYRLDDPEPRRSEDDLKHLSYIYFPGRQLPDGREIDLRGPVGDEVPLADNNPDAPPPDRPRYDPETGELVQPLGVITPPPPPPPHTLPEAQRVLEYSVTADVLEGAPHGPTVLSALMQPVNVLVMLMIAVVHLFLLATTVLAYLLFLLVPTALGCLAILAAHYAILVQEIGLWERDELPRPLRNLQFADDLAIPALQTVAALLLSYWPALLILILNNIAAASSDPLPFPNAGAWLIGLHVLASVIFPAVMLTLCTSGAAANLRPDRVFGVASTIGWRYILLVLLWCVTGPIYLVGHLGCLAGLIASVFFPATPAPLITRVYVSVPLLLTGIYLAHAFCWYLGLEYRRGNGQFPWVLQRHLRKAETIQAPTVHPKIAHGDAQAAQRAAHRRQIR